MSKVKGLWLAAAAGALGSVAATAHGQTQCGRMIGPAIIVGDITGPTNYTASGGLDAFSLGTYSCNPGNQNVLWQSNTTQHPVVGQNLFKLKNVTVNGATYTTFEQMGQSWLKHTFLALTNNLCCTCNGQGGSVLGVGCADPYTSARNGSQGGLGPKWQVNAHTGVFTYPYANPPFQTAASVARRLICSLSDLEVSGGTNNVRYVTDCQYVTADCAAAGNQNIATSYRTASMSGTASDFTLALTNATVREQPAIWYWKAQDAAVTLTTLDAPGRPSGTERYLIGSRATNLNNGFYHYEVAVYNQNGDECVGKITLPLPDSATVQNVGFKGVVYRDGDGINMVNFDSTAWPATRANNTISWATGSFASNANGNAVRWGTMYTFRFDTDAAPAASGNLTLQTWKTIADYQVAAQVPGGGPATCYADCDQNNTLNVNDFVCFQTAFAAASPSADCDHNSTLNVNDFVCFQAAFAAGCP